MSDCSVARLRFRRMSTLASAMVLAMLWLLVTYSAESSVSTVRMLSSEVERTISPNSAKMPKRILWKSLWTRMSAQSGAPVVQGERSARPRPPCNTPGRAPCRRSGPNETCSPMPRSKSRIENTALLEGTPTRRALEAPEDLAQQLGVQESFQADETLGQRFVGLFDQLGRDRRIVARHQVPGIRGPPEPRHPRSWAPPGN